MTGDAAKIERYAYTKSTHLHLQNYQKIIVTIKVIFLIHIINSFKSNFFCYFLGLGWQKIKKTVLKRLYYSLNADL